MREAHPQAFASRAAAMRAGHVGRSPRLIDEHQTLWHQIDLANEPVAMLLQHIETVLLYGVASLFVLHSPTREEAMEPGYGDGQAHSGQCLTQFLKRVVLARLPKGEDLRSLRLDAI